MLRELSVVWCVEFSVERSVPVREVVSTSGFSAAVGMSMSTCVVGVLSVLCGLV